MKLIHQATPSSTHVVALNCLEMILIGAIAVLLPFDHWFFGHIINPAPTRVLGFVLTAVWFVQIVLRQSAFRLRIWHLMALIFVAVNFYSALYSPVIPNPEINNYRYKLIAASKILSAMLFLILACQAFDRKKILLFLRIHVVVGTAICTASLIFYVLHMTKIYPNGFGLWVEPDIYTFVRIEGVCYEPHRFGAYAMTLIPWLLLPKLRSALNFSTRFGLVALAAIFISMMLAYAISTYVALPVLLLMLAVQSKENFARMLRLGLVATIALALLMQIPAVRQGTGDIIDVKMRGESVLDRKYQWQIAVIETWLNPWTGVGPEGYSHFISMIDRRMKNVTPASNPPQSMLFGIMANSGLPGLTSFLLFMLTFLVSYIRRYKNTKGDKTLSYAGIAIVISHFVYQQSIWLPWSLNLWLFMALAWGALTSTQSSENS